MTPLAAVGLTICEALALAEIGIVGDMGQEHLDGDGAVQACVFGFVDSPMPPWPIRAVTS